MKKLITSLSMFTMVGVAMAQFSFSDDFESYSGGAYLAQSSPTWTTWSGTEGNTEDPLVSTAMAHGGTKSVYFSSTATNGGPVDCVLPFGSQFTTGTLVMDFWMLVNATKSAYLNFQQNVTIGQVWNSEWNFNADGTLDVANQYGLNFSTTYPQGSWFHLIITMDLNNSAWTVNIDGTDMGTFHNTCLGVASMNIYPTNGSQYYIDDLTVTHTPSASFTNNIAVSYLTVPGGLSGSQVNIKALLRNLGSSTVANPYVSLYNNGSLVGNQTFTGMNLASMDTQIVVLSSLLTYTASNDISVDAQVSSAMMNDDDTDDDTIVYNYTAITPAIGKLVVAEEGTGTWCQWCPRGAVFMDYMATTYPGFFQGIAVHNGDPMTDAVYDAGMGTLIAGYPSALVDRLPDVDPSAMEPDFITRIQIAPKAMITNGAMWSVTNDTLFVSLTTTFSQAVSSGNYKVACVLIEDNVTGTTSQYNQSNAYAGGGQGPMGGFESLPNPVPAAMMEYDFVARGIQPSFTGLSNAYTIPAAIGYSKTHNFAFPVSSSWSVADMKIVGLFIDPTGKIDNASSTTVSTAINNGFVNVLAVEENNVIDAMNVYPNPTDGMAHLNLNLSSLTEVRVNISTIDGKFISSQQYGALKGVQVIDLNTEGWASGIYLVEVLAGNTSKVVKLSVQ